MIQIEDIHIREFRGIRDLKLRMGCGSYLVWGPNGSGKSGVVDAIDFVLTGNIARLSGEGSGGLSVAKHGPHVYRRDDPASSEVVITLRDTTSGQTAELTRNVRTPSEFTLNPESEELLAAVTTAQIHPELVLSRREIIKYIITEPGRRSQEVQALLKLDRIGTIRSRLKTALGTVKSTERASGVQVNNAEDSLRRHLDIRDLLEGEVLAVVNRHRAALGLPEIDRIDVDTDFAAGLGTQESPPTLDKASAIRDVGALGDYDKAEFERVAAELAKRLGSFETDRTLLDAIERSDFLVTGLSRVVDEHCPFCGVPWADLESLRSHIESEIARAEAAKSRESEVSDTAKTLTRVSQRLRGIIATAKPPAASHGLNDLESRLQAWSDDLLRLETQIGSVAGALTQCRRLADDPTAMPKGIPDDLKRLTVRLSQLPDLSATVNARSFLTVAKDRSSALHQARATNQKATAALSTAQTVYDAYCETADESLAALYETVEEEFSRFYRKINADDEAAFKAELEPSAGKLELNVDFYGLGMFPPAAYHSEGHQDGMGVCLYLALVSRLLGADFRFAVLDDVVMSVDVSHRRQFCELLRARFPGVQFIITTHDEIWARQIQSSGLVPTNNHARFHGWTVEHGPIHDNADFWNEVEADLDNGDVPSAAARLRRALESSMTDLVLKLQGQVIYRADARYELGELLSSVISKHKKLLGAAADSANSWNNGDARRKVKALQDTRATAIGAQGAENWALNPAVHFNEWATFSKPDFLPIVEAWKQLLALFECENPDCTSRIYLVRTDQRDDSLRCACGSYNLNLKLR